MINIHFYNASAGSGKTYKIAEVILDKIRNHSLDPSAIIATTFTNDAAAELKERIRKALVRDKCFNEAIAIRSSLIGTINSIGGQLLERYSLQAGLPSGLKVLEENSARTILERLISNRIDQDFLSLAERLSQREEGGFTKQISEIINLSRINNLDETILDSGLTSFEETAALFGKSDDNNSFIDKANKLLPAIKALVVKIESDPNLHEKDKNGKRLKLYGNLDDLLENLKDFSRQSGIEDSSWYERFGLLDLGPKALPENDMNYKEDFYHLYENYYPLYTCKEFHDDLESYYQSIFKIAIQVRDDYEKFKSERGLIDFTDQEHQLLKLLTENDFVKNDLKHHFSMLVVDEFQDTSPIQLALFLEINKLVKQTIWVGDPKQSIYGFRGADLALVQSVINEIDKKTNGNESFELPVSYRSRKELVHLTNALFSQPFKKSHDMPPKRTCLIINDYRVKTPDTLKTAFQLWKLQNNGNGFNSDYYKNLANKVREVISEGWPIVPKGKETEMKTVPVSGMDIALLFHTNNECRKMAAALIDLGMTVCSKSTGLFSEPETQLLTAILKAAANKSDSLAVAEVMLFETFDGSQEKLLSSRLDKVKEAGDSIDALNSWGESESAWIKLINDSEFRLRNFSLYDKTCWFIGKLGLHQFIAGWPNPGQRTANIEQYLLFLKEYEEMCSSTGEQSNIHAFISFTNQLIENKNDQLGSFTDENTITISTFHAAKGLEWPLVIITDVSYNYKPGDHFFGTRISAAPIFDPKNPLAGRKINLWLKPINRASHIKTERTLEYLKVLWNPPKGEATRLKQLDSERPQIQEDTDAFKQYIEMEQQEDLRKFYVAFTRARDYTILPFFPDKRYTFWEKLGNSVNVVKDQELTEKWAEQIQIGIQKINYTDIFEGLNVPIEIEVVECISATNTEQAGINSTNTLKQIRSDIKKEEYRKAFITPFSLEKTGPGEPAELLHKFSLKLELKQKISNNFSADFGDCIHHFFAAAVHAEHKDYEAIAHRILKNHNFDDHLDAKELANYAKEFFCWINTLCPLRVDSELPVHYISKEGQIFSGNIDFLITSKEGLSIIDHKTFAPSEKTADDVLGALITGRFGNQLKAYSEMMGSNGTQISNLFIHLPMLGLIFKVSEVNSIQ